MNARARRTVVAVVLQIAAAGILAAALLGVPWLDERSLPRLLVLVDRSQSMPQPETDATLARLSRDAKQAGFGEIRRIDFAGRPAIAGAGDIDPTATDLEAALLTALPVNAVAPLAGVVVVSDGFENRGHAATALATLHAAGLPLQWLALGRPPPIARIADVAAPARAQVGQPLQFTVHIAAPPTLPLRLQGNVRSASGETGDVSEVVAGAGAVALRLDPAAPGPVVLDLRLLGAATGATLDTLADAAVVDVTPRATLLYAQGGPAAPLADSLLAGGWTLKRVPAARLDAEADALESYAGVILDDIAVADASPRWWQALVAAVRDRGLGLLVLGGDRAFTLGGYRASALEAVLPLQSEPAALDQSTAVLFAVDKSGSMGQGSDGVDRFEQARRAVIGTAAGLTARDGVGLMVFDIAPRLLMPVAPVGPTAAGLQALARDWPVQPGGGTRILPVLEAALRALDSTDTPRRLLVLVTDGFVGSRIDDAAVAILRSRFAAAHVEILALAVGADADVAALQRLLGPDAVVRVEQAAELPQAMRSAVERRRARVERGVIDVHQTLPLPFPPAQFDHWPPVAAYAVTRASPGATVAVLSRRGDPLVAFQPVGRGRVMAFSAGLGASTPLWLRWAQWPQLAGGLADWIGAVVVGAEARLAWAEDAAGPMIDVELPAGPGVAGATGWRLGVDPPVGPGMALALRARAPGHLRASLPDAGDGLYRFTLTGPHGVQRQALLRHRGGESSHWGTAPALATWRAAGWIADWNPLRLLRAGGDRHLPPDRTLIALALVLFLAGVCVDRAALGRATAAVRWQAWWRRRRVTSAAHSAGHHPPM